MNWFHQRWHSLSGDLHGISGLQRNWKRTYLNKPLVWLFLIKISVVKMWKKNQIWCNNWPVKSGLLRNITPCDDLDVFTWLNSKTEKQEHWVCFLDFYSCALMLKHPIPLKVLNYTQNFSLSGFIVKCLSFRELNYFFKETPQLRIPESLACFDMKRFHVNSFIKLLIIYMYLVVEPCCCFMYSWIKLCHNVLIKQYFTIVSW